MIDGTDDDGEDGSPLEPMAQRHDALRYVRDELLDRIHAGDVEWSGDIDEDLQRATWEAIYIWLETEWADQYDDRIPVVQRSGSDLEITFGPMPEDLEVGPIEGY